MNRNEREMALWHEAWMMAASQDPDPAESSCLADAAVAEFRTRYPVEPVQPPAVWYDEPPFEKGGADHPCWIEGEPTIAYVYWDSFYGALQWLVEYHGGAVVALAGRRVCPIVKPPEPPQ